ncbi:MAG TPA: SOS response-associated peptidase [Syntrophales bacterium]|jgi:putative SOS response-associated peptidase YedK|nr:SOS response-associated peptidase [Syntrophales bacterium]HOU77868.1 SOS response-associated peptidase [Syntrophales bacterium]HPC31751.1 SOS response-associated peptidase [Syntrophales bacterium]HQG34458.1 SOS response-associated peptidase [Syntrophales bacterium]HQI34586.1 SOS response-associated peptidase [Syntrophales bacterium]
MCGRFVLLTDLSEISAYFHIQEVACEYRPRGNIYPGQQIAAVVRDRRTRLVAFRWGLIPSWAKNHALGAKMINARGETVTTKPSFKNAFRNRRCLIVADGFYEWQKTGSKTKKPWFIHLKSGEPFGFAGLYETWVPPEGPPVHSCTIITTRANELIAPIHERMPVIIPREGAATWLADSDKNQEGLLSMLKPYPAEEMECLDRYPLTFSNDVHTG